MVENKTQDATQVGGRVLFLGDSITDDGRFISFLQTYFTLYRPNYPIELRNLGVCSETASGLSEPPHPFARPCVHGRAERALEQMKPDWVFICYGINDGIYYPFSEERFQAYCDGMRSLVQKIHAYGAKVVAMTPFPYDRKSCSQEETPSDFTDYSFMHPYEKYNDVMARYAKWITEELSYEADKTVNLYDVLQADIDAIREKNPEYISGDGIHPNLHGHLLAASTILNEVFSIQNDFFEKMMEEDSYTLFEKIYERDGILHRSDKETVGHDNEFKVEHVVGNILKNSLEQADKEMEEYKRITPKLFQYCDEWNGFKRKIFYFEGYEAMIVFPHKPANNRPWIWRTEFFGAFAFADLALLERGYHVIHLRISNQFGSPQVIEIMENFRRQAVSDYRLSQSCSLFGFSRGGLYALFYAATYPQYTDVIYFDAPVIDIRSWPGGKGVGCGSQYDWALCLKAFGLTEQTVNEYETIRDSAIRILVTKNIPIILIAGDNDEVVPYTENGVLLINAYDQARAPYEVHLKKGIGHHPHSLENPEIIVDFVIKHTT